MYTRRPFLYTNVYTLLIRHLKCPFRIPLYSYYHWAASHFVHYSYCLSVAVLGINIKHVLLQRIRTELAGLKTEEQLPVYCFSTSCSPVSLPSGGRCAAGGVPVAGSGDACLLHLVWQCTKWRKNDHDLMTMKGSSSSDYYLGPAMVNPAQMAGAALSLPSLSPASPQPTSGAALDIILLYILYVLCVSSGWILNGMSGCFCVLLSALVNCFLNGKSQQGKCCTALVESLL